MSPLCIQSTSKLVLSLDCVPILFIPSCFPSWSFTISSFPINRKIFLVYKKDPIISCLISFLLENNPKSYIGPQGLTCVGFSLHLQTHLAHILPHYVPVMPAFRVFLQHTNLDLPLGLCICCFLCLHSYTFVLVTIF